jgi:hypothetical protein
MCLGRGVLPVPPAGGCTAGDGLRVDRSPPGRPWPRPPTPPYLSGLYGSGQASTCMGSSRRRLPSPNGHARGGTSSPLSRLDRLGVAGAVSYPPVAFQSHSGQNLYRMHVGRRLIPECALPTAWYRCHSEPSEVPDWQPGRRGPGRNTDHDRAVRGPGPFLSAGGAETPHVRSRARRPRARRWHRYRHPVPSRPFLAP